MKECVPITAITKIFSYSHKNKTVTVQRKQSPLKLGTSLGSTLEYMKRDFDSTSENSKLNTVPVNQGAMYTILPRAKSRDKIQVVNFELDHIKVNTIALQDILRMRKEVYFFDYTLY